MDMYVQPMQSTLHNIVLLKDAEKKIREAIKSGTSIHIKNKDGESIKLKDGFDFIFYEVVSVVEE